MLKIKFWRIENVLLMKVLEQGNEIKRGDFKFCASNGIKVTSISSPELTPDVIYVRGDNEDMDDEEIDNKVVHFDCEDERKAKILLNRYIEAVRECNSTLPVENKDTDDIEIVIAE